jgi:hypothetical protein
MKHSLYRDTRLSRGIGAKNRGHDDVVFDSNPAVACNFPPHSSLRCSGVVPRIWH